MRTPNWIRIVQLLANHVLIFVGFEHNILFPSGNVVEQSMRKTLNKRLGESWYVPRLSESLALPALSSNSHASLLCLDRFGQTIDNITLLIFAKFREDRQAQDFIRSSLCLWQTPSFDHQVVKARLKMNRNWIVDFCSNIHVSHLLTDLSLIHI